MSPAQVLLALRGMCPSSSRERWFRALPWLVILVAVLPLLELAALALPLAALGLPAFALSLPTSVALHWLARNCAKRAEDGQSVPPIRLAAVIGGMLAMLPVIPVAVLIVDLAGDVGIMGAMLLMAAPVALPPAALLGAGLGAGIVWLQQRPLS